MKKSLRAQSGPLDRRRIALAALDLIDEEGLEALSMRKLGARLGVEAMALYHHFPDKAHLLDVVAELLLKDVKAPASGDWRKRLAIAARRYRQVAVDHPNAFALLTTRRTAGPNAHAAFEGILAVLMDAGFKGSKLAKAFRLVGYFSGGAGHAEIATREGSTVAARGDRRGADAEAFPLLASVQPHFSADRLDAIFEFGLSAIIGALERELSEKS